MGATVVLNGLNKRTFVQAFCIFFKSITYHFCMITLKKANKFQIVKIQPLGVA